MTIGQVTEAQLLVRIVASRTGLEYMTFGTKVECANKYDELLLIVFTTLNFLYFKFFQQAKMSCLFLYFLEEL